MTDIPSIQRAISEIPVGPEWVRIAGLAAIADYIDYTDPEQVAAIVGRPVTAEEMRAVVDKCDVGIRHTSEVLRSLGLLAWRPPTLTGSNPPTHSALGRERGLPT